MTRSSKAKSKRSKKTRQEEEEVEEKATVQAPDATETAKDNTSQTAKTAVGETNEPEVVVVVNNSNNKDEEDEETSKKRSLDEREDENGVWNIGKVIEWSGQIIVNSLGSFFHSFLGTAAPAEPEEGPPAIDGVIPVMLLGPVGVGKAVLQKALLDTVAMGDTEQSMTVDEYKKDFAFETLVGETKTIHSVRLQLYDCYGVDPATEEEKAKDYESSKDPEKDSAAAWQDGVPSVKTIVLVLSIGKKQQETVASMKQWTTWIRQELKDIVEVPKIVLLLTRTDAEGSEESPSWLSVGDDTSTTLNQACQTSGIQSWYFISPENVPNGVPSVDDLLYSLVERSLQHVKPLSKDSTPPSKRRKVDSATVAD